MPGLSGFPYKFTFWLVKYQFPSIHFFNSHLLDVNRTLIFSEKILFGYLCVYKPSRYHFMSYYDGELKI